MDLYRLLTAVYASEVFFKLQKDVDPPPDFVRALRGECELREVHEALLRLAAGFRALQDQENLVGEVQGAKHGKNVNQYHNNCGTLWEDTSKTKSKALTLREACNKILHAKKVEHIYTQYENPLEFSLAPKVMLHGAYGKTWKCEVQILRFTECLFYNYCPRHG
jgi:hypothetical protein